MLMASGPVTMGPPPCGRGVVLRRGAAFPPCGCGVVLWCSRRALEVVVVAAAAAVVVVVIVVVPPIPSGGGPVESWDPSHLGAGAAGPEPGTIHDWVVPYSDCTQNTGRSVSPSVLHLLATSSAAW